MKNKKGFKHYLRFYGMVLAAYTIYAVIVMVQNGGFDLGTALSIILIPLLFVVLVYLFDTALEPFFSRMGSGKKAPIQEAYKTFFATITTAINKEYDFSIEEFRRLRENERFQKALKQAFQIYQYGENDNLNYIVLEKKFKKDTNEYKALEVVISEVVKMREDEGKDYQK